MISEKFNILELTDLALRTPEVGAVNFNILHAVLKAIILNFGLEEVKAPCYIENETLAQTAITKSRMADEESRRRSSMIHTVQEMKERLEELEGEEIPLADEDALQQVLQEEKRTLFDDVKHAENCSEAWRAIHINRRMDAAETGMTELSKLVDDLLDMMQDLEDQRDQSSAEEIAKLKERITELEGTCKTLALRIEDCNEQREAEVERLEELIKDMKNDQEEAKNTLQTLEKNYIQLAEDVAYTTDLEGLKAEMSEVMEEKTKSVRKLIRKVEDSLVKKADFIELVTRVENLEDTKVNRDELGRLLEPGFIDSFLDEQANLRSDIEELKEKVDRLEENMEDLKTMIQEEVMKPMEAKFAEVHSMLDTINEKLDLLDPDEINDSFANLEEQDEMILKELEQMKLSAEEFQKEARINFKKIANFSEQLKRLELTKMDKSRMNDLLETKADKDLLWRKMDKSEFDSAVREMKDNLERLTIQVKINEEEMNQNFTDNRHQLSLKMYTEDFIIATKPMRNRIKDIIYELKRVKEIALQHLFPDAPGIAKCMSCNRGANLSGPKYLGDANIELLQEVPPNPHNLPKPPVRANLKKVQDSKLPPIDDMSDLDSVSIPPPDTPRETSPLQLPVLFAKARPQIGVAYPKLQKDIDKELATYFATRPLRLVDGRHTNTAPQQRGLKFVAASLAQPEREKILLKGADKGVYRGALYESSDAEEDTTSEDEIKSRSENSDETDVLTPSTVSLHAKSVSSKRSQNVSFPSNT